MHPSDPVARRGDAPIRSLQTVQNSFLHMLKCSLLCWVVHLLLCLGRER